MEEETKPAAVTIASEDRIKQLEDRVARLEGAMEVLVRNYVLRYEPQLLGGESVKTK